MSIHLIMAYELATVYGQYGCLWLQRTKLCELPDSELEQSYVKARDKLRTLVRVGALPTVAALRLDVLDCGGVETAFQHCIGTVQFGCLHCGCHLHCDLC